MMLAGIIMNSAGVSFFADNNTLRIIWYVIAFLPVGVPVIREAVEAAVRGDVFNEFSLMSIACIGAFCIREYPEAVGVMVFYSIGETLEGLAVRKATGNISRLLDVRGEHALVMRDGEWRSVNPRDVKPGEEIEVRPGGRVPLDGVLSDSEATFDTSALTGESVPRLIEKGSDVLAGMISSESTVHIRVTKEYGQSTLSRILALVEDASSRKAPAEQFIRKFARVYTPVVTLLAVLLVAVPALVGIINPDFHYVFSQWLYRGLVFLVISCPCALVISVPLGYFAGIGAASKAGILFKGGNYLDAITRLDTVAFDKTGTLTTGKFHVGESKVAPESAREMSNDFMLTLLAAVEGGSSHPVATAITAAARDGGLDVPAASDMKEYPGLGAEATVDGHRVVAGNTRLLQRLGIAYPSELDKLIYTTVACAVDGRYAGYLLLTDTLKDDSLRAVNELHGQGIRKVVMLSGDKKEIAEDCARKLGMDEVHGALMPQDKAEYVERLATDGHHRIAFVGDGFNDAPVLAVSNVGIAMGGLGSDAAIESADVVIQTDQPSKVATAIRIGRCTRSIVMQNIVGAIAIKVIILLLGALGYATLWGAVFADVGVALLAVGNSMRILWKHRFN